MTIIEKLNHFSSVCLADANQKSSQMLEEYTASLREELKHHQNDARKQAKLQLASEKERLRRCANKQLSLEQLRLKREYCLRQAKLKEQLFEEVKRELSSFMETEDYQKLLEEEAREALAFAKGAPVTIYLSESDRKRMEGFLLPGAVELEEAHLAFPGGLLAAVPSKNILIDHSFQARLEELYDTFEFQVG